MPKPKVFKGMDVKIVDCLKLDTHTPVQFPDRAIPEIREDGVGVVSYGVNLATRLCFIMGVKPAGKYYTVTLQPYNSTKSKFSLNVMLTGDYTVRMLTGKQATTMQEWYADFKNNEVVNLLSGGFGGRYVGCDPEVFLEDKDGINIPAFLLMYSKKDAARFGYTYYWDGFAAEFNTQPTGCLAYQVDNIQNGLKQIYLRLKEGDKNGKLSLRNTIEVSKGRMETSTEEQLELGCLPSLNAYGLTGKKVANGKDLTTRFTGGHLHFGIGNQKTQQQYINIVKSLDKIMGVACVSLFQGIDTPTRREYYGLPGEYRLPPHGLEYRTLSNAWLAHPLMAHLVFDLSRKALVLAEKGADNLWIVANEKEYLDCILQCDVKKAQEIMNRNKAVFCKMIMSCYPGFTKEHVDFIFNIFINGMSSVVKDVNDIEGNWKLNGKWTTHSGDEGKSVASAIPKLLKSNGKI